MWCYAFLKKKCKSFLPILLYEPKEGYNGIIPVLLPKSLKYGLGFSEIKRECPGDICRTCNDGPACYRLRLKAEVPEGCYVFLYSN
jgi:hypothetical protein